MQQSITTSNIPYSLLALPTELRLEIYKYFLKDCLADGSVSDVAGLYLCCRTIYGELETEFMPTIRSLLIAKSKYDAAGSRHGLSSFKIHLGFPATAGKAELSINFKIPNHRDYEALEPGPVLRLATENLWPALNFHWTVLILDIGTTDGFSFQLFDVTYHFRRFFFCFPACGARFLSQPSFDRLILKLSEHYNPASVDELADPVYE